MSLRSNSEQVSRGFVFHPTGIARAMCERDYAIWPFRQRLAQRVLECKSMSDDRVRFLGLGFAKLCEQSSGHQDRGDAK